MALTILTAGLAACGLLLLLWSVAEAMLLPLPREDAVLVAPLQGGAAEVERQIRGCRWMREHRGLRAQIIWIDRGLTPEGEDQAAVMSVIYDGIKAGRESMDTTAFCRCVERLSARGAELMVLGCTELPLAVELYHIHCRCIDPATELAKAAVRFALGREPKSI